MSEEQHIPSAFLAPSGLDSLFRKLDGTLIGTQIGMYQILSVLGKGGMGEVYCARDTRLGRSVAVKVLPQWMGGDGEGLARFKKEAKTLASLNHPHIAAIYDVLDIDGIHAIVMELVDGVTLAGRIAQGRIPFDEAVLIATQITEALEAAHEQGIVHRDLKPANITVRHDGTVKVLDFGLAKATQPVGTGIAESSATEAANTAKGVIVGTPAYMSPEQARGQTTDKRSDIWAFGCVLYEMLTGRPAFEGATTTDLLAAVLTTQPDWAALPPGEQRLNILIRRCLEKDSKRRLRDIGEARLALDGWGVPPVSTERPARRSVPVALWISTTVACLATGLAAWAMYSSSDPPAQPTLRYEISAHPDARIASFALSPDGARLAFTTVGETSIERRRLWVRRLDALEAEPVPGGEGALGAFWSPDSRTLAYFTGTELRRVDLLGGPSEKVCDAPLQVTGAWSRDGVILFTGPDGQLHRVSFDGGQTQQATAIDATRKEIAHRFPQFLPDGQHFLYTAISATGDNSGLYVASLQSMESKRLLTTNTNVAFTRDARGQGYLMYVRGEMLLGQRFNPGRLTLEGDPFPVGANLATPAGIFDVNVFPQFSSSIDGVIGYQRGGALTKELVWLDRSGRRLSTLGEPADYSNLALSRDERKLAISRLDPQLRTRDIWTFDVERGASTRFTAHGADDTNPVWSPDGRLIAYTSTRNGQRSAYMKEVDGTGEGQQLYGSRDTMTTHDWSSDGRFLLVTDSALLMEGDRKLIPLPNWTNPSISPDRKWVAYHSNESGRTEIYVQSFPEVLAGRSARRWPVSNAGGTYPEWRKDTQELFYLTLDGQLMAVAVKGNGAALELGPPQPLFRMRIEAAHRRAHYQPAANGQRFLVVQLPESETPKPITVVVNWPDEQLE